ncbi:AI-2E family transporter [Vallitalea pronyensis]|uniref:AI-2E family transporter n=1 Tax=Vallitalea pronyensis TaxID=1348613 RepID=A0A8J8SF83_9FIRM|nr:AI-2E family transporter [Vallitalea pronyensis]QUI21147.1 AI-2E family transporter [Vallitalea pronyensis]
MKIRWNKQYTTISVYALLVIFAGLIFYKFIGNWEETKKFLRTLLQTLSPFILGFLIAYFIDPLVVWYEKCVTKMRIRKFQIKHPKIKRSLAILLTYITVLGFIIMILAFVIPELAKSIADLVNGLPDLTTDIVNTLTAFIEDKSSQFDFIDPDKLEATITEYIPTTIDSVREFVPSIMNSVFDMTKNFTFGIFNVILGFIIAIYLLVSKEKSIAGFEKGIIALFHEKTSSNILFILKDSHRIFSSFFVGKLIDSLIIGALCFVITAIARIPNPLLISVFVGVTNMIPYFGPFIGGFFGIVLVFIQSPIQALWFALIILGLQQFDGNILGPKILGDSTGLSPFWVIFSILIGGKFFGIFGMFLGVPFFAVIKNIIDRHIESKYKKRMEDKRQQELLDESANLP